MVHTAAVAVHAALALLALVAALRTWRTGRGRAVPAAALLGSTAALAVAVPTGWAGLEPVTRVAYPALLVLALVMSARALRVARGTAPADHRDRDDLGFVVIGLVDGLVVVSAFRAGVPGWALLVLGAAVVVAGHVVLSALQRRRPVPA